MRLTFTLKYLWTDFIISPFLTISSYYCVLPPCDFLQKKFPPLCVSLTVTAHFLHKTDLLQTDQSWERPCRQQGKRGEFPRKSFDQDEQGVQRGMNNHRRRWNDECGAGKVSWARSSQTPGPESWIWQSRRLILRRFPDFHWLNHALNIFYRTQVLPCHSVSNCSCWDLTCWTYQNWYMDFTKF